MRQIPALGTINSAELRLFQSRRNLQQSVDQTRLAVRDAIRRPSNLMLVAVASGISAFLLFRRRRPVANSEPVNGESATKASKRGVIMTLVSLYGAQLVDFLVHQAAAAFKKSTAPQLKKTENVDHGPSVD